MLTVKHNIISQPVTKKFIKFHNIFLDTHMMAPVVTDKYYFMYLKEELRHKLSHSLTMHAPRQH